MYCVTELEYQRASKDRLVEFCAARCEFHRIPMVVKLGKILQDLVSSSASR